MEYFLQTKLSEKSWLNGRYVFMEIRSLVLIFDAHASLILGQYWWEKRGEIRNRTRKYPILGSQNCNLTATM